MNVEAAIAERARVEEFQRSHRIELVTMLFTDLVDSTGLKGQIGDRAAIELLKRHDILVRSTLAEFSGAAEINGAGDSFFLVFAKPSDAARFALLLQHRMRALTEPGQPALRDRVGIHVGEVFVEDRRDAGPPRNFYGLQVDMTARVMSMSAGDQILMTRFVFDNSRQILRGSDLGELGELRWLNHGLYQLKGVEEAVEIGEVGEVGLAHLGTPRDSEKGRRTVPADGEIVQGWRPGIGLMVPQTAWRLVEKLGEGGFGEVWLAAHERLKERHVFKFCFRADRARSLKREVTLFRLLKERVGEHPNLIRVYDVNLDEPPFFLEMDYASGRDLAKWAAARGGAGTLDEATCVDLIAQCADALQAAHAAGVIHRDVKPSNILVSETAGGGVRAQLTDFGIGHVVAAETLAGITQLGFTETLTDTGTSQASGTFLYLAPEILRGVPATPSSDVYALSVVLFQLLSGDLQQPVTADWARKIADETLRADLARGLASEPADRFGSAQEFCEALRTLPARRAANRTQAVATQKTQSRRRLTRQARAATACLLAGGFALKLLEGKPTTGELLITSDPAGAQVWQDGKKVGVTPFAVHKMKPGMAEYTLTADGFDSCTIFATIEAGRTLAWQMPMRPVADSQIATAEQPPKTFSESPSPRGASVPIPTEEISLSSIDPPPPIPKPEPKSVGVLTGIEGVVEIMPPGGTWSRASPGQVISVGDRIRTGEHSRVSIQYSDRSVVRFDELTTLEMLPRAGAGGGGKGELKLEKGSLFYFGREKPRDVKIRTAAANGVLKG